MLKSNSSSPISSRILRSVRIVPNDGFVSYHASTSFTSVMFSTDHSAQPVLLVLPANVFSRICVNTVPEDTIVGGVPQKIVCGFGDDDTTYFSVVS